MDHKNRCQYEELGLFGSGKELLESPCEYGIECPGSISHGARASQQLSCKIFVPDLDLMKYHDMDCSLPAKDQSCPWTVNCKEKRDKHPALEKVHVWLTLILNQELSPLPLQFQSTVPLLLPMSPQPYLSEISLSYLFGFQYHVTRTQ